MGGPVRFTLSVPDVPPKKDAARSMWMKPFQVERLKRLRLAAVSAVTESGKVVPTGLVHLSVHIYAPPELGDLDSFVSGICDGLMAAHPLVPIDPSLWSELPEEARPDRPIIFVDDRVITKIEAERHEADSFGIRYELVLEIV
jgi:hypothetical protein